MTTMEADNVCSFDGLVLISVLIIINNGLTVSSSIDENYNILGKGKLARVNQIMLSSSTNSSCCRKDCKVTRSGLEIITDCDGAQCKCIPYEQIPDQTTKLSIRHNKLVAIRNGSFENFTDMEMLSLSYNNIQIIDARAFIGLHKLLFLDVSNNPLNTIPDDTFSPLHSLQTLLLKNVSSSCDSFNPIDFYNLENLTHFSFSLNRQYSFPKFDVNHSSIMPVLETLDLSQNNLKALVKANFNHLKSVRVLLINNNDIQFIGATCFLAMKTLEILNLEHNLLFKLKASSFWSTSLQLLNLADSGFKLSQRDSFQHLPNLKQLILKKCTFPPKANMKHLFSNLRNLTHLNLQRCKLRSVQVKKLLKPLRNLEKLLLTGNSLINLDRTIFEPFAKSLKDLRLDDTKLSTVNITSLPTKLWTSLDKVNLGGNPWNCDCGLIWFRLWFRSTNVTITDKDLPDRYMCAFGPKEIGNKRLQYLRYSTVLKCFETKQDWWLVIVSAFTFFVNSTVFLASPLQRFRWHIKYWIFLYSVMYCSKNSIFTNSYYEDSCSDEYDTTFYGIKHA